jgi:hypothetical protein
MSTRTCRNWCSTNRSFANANIVKLYGNDHKESWPWVGDLQAHISLGKLSSELLLSATEEQGNDKKGEGLSTPLLPWQIATKMVRICSDFMPMIIYINKKIMHLVEGLLSLPKERDTIAWYRAISHNTIRLSVISLEVKAQLAMCWMCRLHYLIFALSLPFLLLLYHYSLIRICKQWQKNKCMIC